VLYVAALLWFFYGVSLALDSISKGGRPPAWYVYTLAFPFIYLPFCLLSCTRFLRGRALFVSGILMHLALALWVIASGSSNLLAVGVTLTLLWRTLYSAKIEDERAAG
jgi:hypothetical protein